MDRPPSTMKQLYLPLHAKGVALVTPFALISALIIIATIVAIVCAALAFNVTIPLSVNAASLLELDLKRKLKTVQGANPERA